MQERRTTVRVPYQCRTQYCAAEDLLPRDGRLINVSERGAALLVRESRKAGEQVTASFSLPGSSDTLTATGIVRWSSAAGKGRWHTLGMEWLPLEEASRNRLHAFLQAQPAAAAVAPAAPAAASSVTKTRFAWLPWACWAAVILAGGFALMSWVQSLKQRAEKLESGLAQRNTVITVLQAREQRMAQREKWLRQELVTAKTHLASASGEMAQLDAQVQSLGGDAQRLRQEVDLFQLSYNKVQQERAELIQEVLNLEQERLKLVGKLSSLPELQRAIRETIEAKRQARRAEWASFFASGRSPRVMTDADISPNDNQGFVVRNGVPTLRRGSSMSIRVLEPQAGDSIKK